MFLAKRRDGTSPAEKFLEDLSKSDQAKMLTLLQRASDVGWMNINNPTKFKKVADGWFEFKCFQIRMLCYSTGNDLTLTHGFLKKRDGFQQSEIERAKLIRFEHEERLNSAKPDVSRGKKR
jgi:hypothetical protein